MPETTHPSLKFTQLEEAMQLAQSSVPKIQRVAHYLRDRKHLAKHYSPKLVSIGPIHNGAENLKLGEKYKLMWAEMYLERTNQVAQILYQKIASNIQQLKELFAEDVIGDSPDDEKLSWMLFVDGCSLLQILEKGNLEEPEEMKAKVDQLVLVWRDVLLLENQLPYQLLQLLSGPENDAELFESMNKFLNYHHLLTAKSQQEVEKQDMGSDKTKDEDSALAEEGYTSVYLKNEDNLQGECILEIPQEPPFHLLDHLRRTVLYHPHQDNKKNTKNNEETNEDNNLITHRNMQELKAAGIKLKKINSRKLRDIFFSGGWLCAELKLPEVIVDDTTAPTFLNLIAYEMCPDFKNNFQICSFVAFMDSLIDHPDDVKELRSAGVLQNALGSDEEVANLFNTISSDLVHDSETYSHVRLEIEKHYRNKWKTWLALGYHTYFNNPWAIIAFLAALVALVLTFVQTWLAISQ